MSKSLITFEYNGNPIEFSIEENVMINATEMARPFGRKVEAFLRNDDTKRFIEACLKSENSSLINAVKYSDLVQARKKRGTYMHRFLALKFAAWLNPTFEIWVWATIEKVLYGPIREAMEKARAIAEKRARIDVLSDGLKVSNDVYREIIALEKEVASLQRQSSTEVKNQLTIF